MQNTPELNGKYLGTISSDFVKIADLIKEAAWQIRKHKLSEFPIFPISKVEIPIGALLVKKGETESKEWNFYASTLEEFTQRTLVDLEQGEKAFKETYKNPDEFCCLFVVDESFTNFVYIPYPNED